MYTCTLDYTLHTTHFYGYNVFLEIGNEHSKHAYSICTCTSIEFVLGLGLETIHKILSKQEISSSTDKITSYKRNLNNITINYTTCSGNHSMCFRAVKHLIF